MYSRKILITFGIFGLIVNVGWMLSSYYYMSNSDVQARFFAIHGIITVQLLLMIGLVLMAAWISPINRCLLLMDANKTVSDELLLTAAKRNDSLPLYGMFFYDIEVIIGATNFFIYYRLNHIGIIASVGIYMAALSAIFAVAFIVYGFFSLLTRDEFAQFIEETEKRGLAYKAKKTKMQTELLILVILVLLANITFNTSLGFYDGYNQIKAEATAGIQAFQEYIVRDVNRNNPHDISVDTLKPVLDNIIDAGIGASFIVNRHGHILYNPKDIQIYVPKWEDINQKITNAIKQKKTLGLYENINERVICIKPINNDYRLVTVSNLKERLPRFKTYWLWVVFFVVAAMFVGIACGYSTISSISETIVFTIDRLKTISTGEWDLTERLKIRNNNEVGDLIRWFNKFIDTLQRIITDIASDAKILNTSASDLSTLSGDMSQGAGHMSGKSDSVSAAVEEMSTSMASMATTMTQTSANFNNIATSVESITTAISDITKNTTDSQHITEEAVTGTANAMAKVDTLESAAQAIGKITDVITDISEQTNLLALNATIEAARAGDTGKGFAVVAGEIKALAHQTNESIFQIRSQIEHMQNSSAETTAEITKIKDIMDKVNNAVATIAGTVDQLYATSKEISANVTESSHRISEINTNVTQNASVAESIGKDMAEVSMNAGEMSSSSALVNKNVAALAKLANHMNELVKQFKI